MASLAAPLPAGRPPEIRLEEWVRDPLRWLEQGDRISLPQADMEAVLLDRLRWKAWALALAEAGSWKQVGGRR